MPSKLILLSCIIMVLIHQNPKLLQLLSSSVDSVVQKLRICGTRNMDETVLITAAMSQESMGFKYLDSLFSELLVNNEYSVRSLQVDFD
jgi:hypothetical protein